MMNERAGESISSRDAPSHHRVFAFTALPRIARGRIDLCAPVPYLWPSRQLL